jgi:hypothetical protein
MIFCFTGNVLTRLIDASLSAFAQAHVTEPTRKDRIPGVETGVHSSSAVAVIDGQRPFPGSE